MESWIRPFYSRPFLHLSSRVLIFHIPSLKPLKPHPQISPILILIENFQRYIFFYFLEFTLHQKLRNWIIPKPQVQKSWNFEQMKLLECSTCPQNFINFWHIIGVFSFFFPKIWKIKNFLLVWKSKILFSWIGFLLFAIVLYCISHRVEIELGYTAWNINKGQKMRECSKLRGWGIIIGRVSNRMLSTKMSTVCNSNRKLRIIIRYIGSNICGQSNWLGGGTWDSGIGATLFLHRTNIWLKSCTKPYFGWLPLALSFYGQLLLPSPSS